MNARLTKHLFLSSILAIGGNLLVACDEGEIPVFPPKDAGTTTDSGTTTNVVRTVETRNPFGDTTMPSNLLVDGDFELTGRSEQMPWVAFTSGGQATLNYATGGQCKSGVRCATIASGTQLVGFFASPKNGGMTGSLWIRPDSGNCNDVQVRVLDLNDQGGNFVASFSVSNQDAQGWCSMKAEIPNMAEKQPVIYVAPNDGMQGNVRIDDGVVLPDPTTQSFTRSAFKLSSIEAARVRFISDWIRTHRRFDAPPQAHQKP